MGYRDDFFILENIVGITGPVNELPSVYFRNRRGEFGHITQVHNSSYNWGRTHVRTDPGWQIVNMCPPQCGCGRSGSHEIDGRGRVFHVSRSIFVPVASLSNSDLHVAAESIHRCPYMKTDPRTRTGRRQEEQRFQALWQERHQKDALGRRGAIDYTAEGLANQALKIAYPNRL